jgi:hypothetical protein
VTKLDRLADRPTLHSGLLPATVGRDLMALREGKASIEGVFPISERRVA